jgi:hypothetical protein
MKADIDSKSALAEANRGLSVERASRVDENIALGIERRAAAVKDQDQGLLALVQAMRNIETTDIGHIKELFVIQDMMQQRQNMQTASSDAQSQDKKAEAIATVSPKARQPQQPEQQATPQ